MRAAGRLRGVGAETLLCEVPFAQSTGSWRPAYAYRSFRVGSPTSFSCVLIGAVLVSGCGTAAKPVVLSSESATFHIVCDTPGMKWEAAVIGNEGERPTRVDGVDLLEPSAAIEARAVRSWFGSRNRSGVGLAVRPAVGAEVSVTGREPRRALHLVVQLTSDCSKWSGRTDYLELTGVRVRFRDADGHSQQVTSDGIAMVNLARTRR